MTPPVRIFLAVAAVALVVVGVWYIATRGRESTDDAQVDAHVTPIAARVGGRVVDVAVADNQEVAAGAVLVAIDPRDYEIALERASAELADAEASAAAARATVPVTSATTSSAMVTAHGAVDHAAAAIDEADRAVEAAEARLAAARSRRREVEASATLAALDLERLSPLLAKDEIPRQRYETATAAADAARAALDSAASQVREAEAGVKVAESRRVQVRVAGAQAEAAVRAAATGPQQVAAMEARYKAAEAHARQMKAAVAQAERHLQFATITAPVAGVVSRRSVEKGQLVQPGQPLLTIIPLDRVWVRANFKETQLAQMQPGQRVRITVDAYGGRVFDGRVESLAAATGSRFSLLPPDNATGNFVKVVQRVPVRITLDEQQDPAQLLRPGMSVRATVYTR